MTKYHSQVASYKASGLPVPSDLQQQLELVVNRFTDLEDPDLVSKLQEDMKKEAMSKVASMKAKGMPIPGHLQQLVTQVWEERDSRARDRETRDRGMG